MANDALPHPQIDDTRAHTARIWNYWLGGKDNYPIDREGGDQIRKLNPGIDDYARAEGTPEIPARHRDQADRHRETAGHRVRPRLLIARSRSRNPAGRRKPPRPPGPRTVEPRATPAATRGQKACPHSGDAITKTDSKTEKEHQAGNAPEPHKHLKSVVLRPDPGSGRPTDRGVRGAVPGCQG